MFSNGWLNWSVIIVAAVCSWASKPLLVRWALEAKWSRRVKLLSAARLLHLAFVMLAVLAQLVVSSGVLSAPARWVVCGAATVCVLACFINAVAGLWLLSSSVDVVPGDRLFICGHSGRVLGYGLTRLDLITDTDELVSLPYLALATRPIVRSRRSAMTRTEIRLKGRDWTDDMIQFVRQAAILAPYRVLSSPVHVSRAKDVVTVQLSLVRHGSDIQIKRFVEAALARYDGEMSDAANPKHGQPSKDAAFVQGASIVSRGDPHAK